MKVCVFSISPGIRRRMTHDFCDSRFCLQYELSKTFRAEMPSVEHSKEMVIGPLIIEDFTPVA